MIHHLADLIESALTQLRRAGALPDEPAAAIAIEHTRQKAHGDFACNIALLLAKAAGVQPRALAERIVAALPASEWVAKVEIAGPGFINFFLARGAYEAVISQVLAQGAAYGRSGLGQGRAVQLEFVSANPTGPLHVGHGRGAAYGATLGNLLEAVGFQVHREYYVNDAGRQMDILATSIWLRYLELCGEAIAFPANGYQGDYVWDIAATLHRTHAEALRHPAAEVLADLPPDADEPGGDKEARIDALIARAKSLLGMTHYRLALDTGLEAILGDIRRDLEEFGVHYDEWFSERALIDDGAVERAVGRLRAAGQLYEKGGAVWFRSSDFGDEKDRVVVRENGQHTYFASDIAYHMHKLERGYVRLVDIWGADHHGYVSRVKAALAAMGHDPKQLDVLLVQFAVLYRGGKKLQMSTRSGEFVTLRELRREVGNDAARFFYVLRKCEQHMDFDLDLAKSESNDNPVYYVQYAHARICSVFRQLQEKGLCHDPENGERQLSLLVESHEQELMATLARYPEVVEAAALNEDPHQLAHYLRELANDFHTYYNAHTFIADTAELRDARLNLITAVRQVIANGLALMGVSAPESM